jgi:uncharacterized protein YndB with AHSA1/START domain
MTQTDQPSATASGDYQRTIRVNAPPAALFDALTTASALTEWWTRATGSGEAGGELKFFMNSPEPLVVHVDELTPASVEWRVTDCPFLTDWVGTRPTFTITPLADTTEVHFRHHGLTQELECIEMCTNSWNHYLASLRDYVEAGRGNPMGSPADQARRAQEAATTG